MRIVYVKKTDIMKNGLVGKDDFSSGSLIESTKNKIKKKILN